MLKSHHYILPLLVCLLISCRTEQVTAPPTCPACANPLLDSSAQVTISSVADGDTFSFIERNEKIDIRILGIDTYETRHGARLDSQAVHSGIDTASAIVLGKIAKAFADSLLRNRIVSIYRDPHQPNFDVYGRLLRHVFFTEGTLKIDYGTLMLQKKLALVDTL